MLKIGYFGDGPWASRAIEEIVKFSDILSIQFITPRYDTQDPALRRWSERLGVPFLISENVNSPSFINKINELCCDVLVSMSFNQILKSEIRNCTPKGFINCHAGALPFYRGRNPLNWVLINDEKEFGVTVHHVDEGIDTGDIIVQKKSEITDSDTYATLLERAHALCAESILEALISIGKGVDSRIPQNNVGFYCGRRRPGDEKIDWYQESRMIFNFVRALSLPGPCARSYGESGSIAILESEMIANAPVYVSTVGEIVGKNEKGVFVKTLDSVLLITKAAPVLENGLIGEVFTPKWKIGTRI